MFFFLLVSVQIPSVIVFKLKWNNGIRIRKKPPQKKMDWMFSNWNWWIENIWHYYMMIIMARHKWSTKTKQQQPRQQWMNESWNFFLFAPQLKWRNFEYNDHNWWIHSYGLYIKCNWTSLPKDYNNTRYTIVIDGQMWTDETNQSFCTFLFWTDLFFFAMMPMMIIMM